MSSKEGLAPIPAEGRVNARLAELEAVGYAYEACMKPGQSEYVIHTSSPGNEIAHGLPEGFEDPLEVLDYFRSCIERAKAGDFDIVYVLEAGVAQSTDEELPEISPTHLTPNIIYMPGATTFLSKRIS